MEVKAKLKAKEKHTHSGSRLAAGMSSMADVATLQQKNKKKETQESS